MSTDINNSAYSTLNTYTILATAGLTTVRPTTVSNGFYGTPAGVGQTGTFVGTADNSGNTTTAETELTALVNAIALVPVTSTISGGSGTLTYTTGRYTSVSTINFTTSTNIILDAQGDSNAQFFFTSGTSMNFDNVNSITLVNGASTCNVFWQAGSAITFTGTSPAVIPGIFIAGSQITFANASQVVGRLYVQYTSPGNITFDGVAGSNLVDGICTTNPDIIVCYLKGTLILTKDGYVPIENIKAGDKVVTKGQIFKNKFINTEANLRLDPVTWVSKFKVVNLNSESRPICIKKDALGKNYPLQDLYVSPGHSLLIKGKMVLAKNMVNGTTIFQDTKCENVEYYHLECDYHSAIIANGVLSESYLEINNRDVFENSIRLQRKFDLKRIHSLR